jgi:hypothetical protein
MLLTPRASWHLNSALLQTSRSPLQTESNILTQHSNVTSGDTLIRALQRHANHRISVMQEDIKPLHILRFHQNAHAFANRNVTCAYMCSYFNVTNLFELTVWWPGLKNSPTVTHACRKRPLKCVPSAWGYSWATLSSGVKNTETWSSRLGVGRWTNNQAP